MRQQRIMASPLGMLTLTAERDALVSLDFGTLTASKASEDKLLRAAEEELRAYFKGQLRCFSLPLAPEGTLFQQKVWRALLEIPYGETRSYGEIAKAIGSPRASRAVGRANHQNPLPILIPCHRVIGADGSLTGYGGGLTIKEQLLKIEGRLI